MEPQPHLALRAAAALAYHVPGLGLWLIYPHTDIRVLVAPAASADAALHPAELRDLLAADAVFDAVEALADTLGTPRGVTPEPHLAPLVPGVRDRMAGLIEISDDPPSFVFATFLGLDEIALTASGSATMPDEVVLRPVPSPTPEAVDVLRVRPLRDHRLGVTVVIIEPYPTTPFGLAHRLAPIAQAIAAACAVAELTGDAELL